MNVRKRQDSGIESEDIFVQNDNYVLRFDRPFDVQMINS